MSVKELRQKSAADLQKELLGLRREQFNLRMAQATGQPAKPDQFGKVRRSIAQLKTVLGEQQRAAKNGAPVAAAPSEPKSVKAGAAKAKTVKAKAAPKAAKAKTTKAKSKSA